LIITKNSKTITDKVDNCPSESTAWSYGNVLQYLSTFCSILMYKASTCENHFIMHYYSPEALLHFGQIMEILYGAIKQCSHVRL